MANNRIHIQILCEGQEEWWYIKKLLSFKRYNTDLFSFPEPINVKTNTQLLNRFQLEYSKNKHDLILIFCDVDKDIKKLHEMITTLAINMDIDFDVAKKLFIFANPVTLQIVLSHFEAISLSHVSKSKNAAIIEKLTGIKNYSAREDQIKEMMNKIKYSSYETMKENLKNVSCDPKDVPSTNFLEFINRIESDDCSWFIEITDKI